MAGVQMLIMVNQGFHEILPGFVGASAIGGKILWREHTPFRSMWFVRRIRADPRRHLAKGVNHICNSTALGGGKPVVQTLKIAIWPVGTHMGPARTGAPQPNAADRNV